MPRIVKVQGQCSLHTHPLRTRIERLMHENVFHRAIWTMVQRERVKDPAIPTLGISMLRHHRETCLSLPGFTRNDGGSATRAAGEQGKDVEGAASPSGAVLADVTKETDKDAPVAGACPTCGMPRFIPTDKMLHDKLKAELYQKVGNLTAKELKDALVALDVKAPRAPARRAAAAPKEPEHDLPPSRSRVATALGAHGARLQRIS